MLCHGRELTDRVARLLGATKKDSFKSQQSLCNRPTLVKLSDQVLRRYAHIIKEDLTEFLVPHNIFDRPDRNPRSRQINQQETDTRLFFRVLVGAHQREHMRCILRKRRPYLLAIDDKHIAVSHGFSPQRSQIRSRTRLRVPLTPYMLARNNLWQKFFLLRRASALDQ